eukprot:Skav228361  [mRNA]  locus=scaffold1981:117582:121517:+ [translate_table: standard]
MLKYLAAEVKQATRADDRAFFDALAFDAGKADTEGGLQKIWKKIRFTLPKHRSKRLCARPDLFGPLLQHFEQLEAGTTTPFATAWNACLTRQSASCSQHNKVVALEELPTLFEIESICRRQTPGKAPGLDGIVPDLLHLAPHAVALQIHSLIHKSVITSQEPFQFKGGRLVALHKGNGSIRQADRYRGILLSSSLAKVGHAWLRAKLLPIFQAVRSPGQLGGRPHQQTAVAMHTLRLHARQARRTHTSTAILFIDLRSAYHHLLRELVFEVNEPLAREELTEIFDSDDFDLDQLAARLADARDRFDSVLPQALRLLLADVHEGTWFTLANPDQASEQCTSTKRGTRPGSPLADIGFGMLLARLMNQLEQWLDAHPAFQAGSSQMDIRAPTVIWADDVAISMAATTPEALVALLRDTSAFVWDLLRDAGLTVNLEAKKTEVVLMFRGPGAVEARLKTFPDDRTPELVVPCRDHLIKLKISASYKHLGGRYGMAGDLTEELGFRQKEARRAFAELRRPLFANRFIGTTTKLRLLQSLVISKLLYGAAVWADMSLQHLHALDSCFMRWVRSITGRGFWDETARSTDDDLRAEFHLPTIRLVLAKMRLKYLHFVVHWADQWYVDLLLADCRCEGSWLAAVAVDFRWLSSVIELPRALLDAFEADWTAFFSEVRAHPSWCALIERAFRRSTMQEVIALNTFKLHKDIDDTLAAHDVQWEGTQPQPDAPLPAELHPCAHCSVVCLSKQQLGAHLFSGHGIYSDERGFAQTSTCPGCLKDFRTSARLVQHLKYRGNGCFSRLAGVRPPDEPTTVKLPPHLQDVKRLPCVRRLYGPLRPLPHERHRTALLTKKFWLTHEAQAWADIGAVPEYPALLAAFSLRCEAWLDNFAGSTTMTLSTLADQFVDIVMELYSVWGAPVEVACVDWLQSQRDSPHNDQLHYAIEYVIADWAAEIPLWDLRCQLADIEEALLHPPDSSSSRPAAPGLARVRERDILTLHFDRLTLWEKSRRDRPILKWPSPPATLELPFRVFVHLYSGRRRPGDVHSWLEHYLAGQPGHSVLLSLDTAVHPALNIWDHRLWSFLCDIARAGRLAALLLGPPCETWTAARHRALLDLHGRALRGPRPLRSKSQPWGIAFRGLSELKQVNVGSTLLLRGVHLAVITALNGGVVLGEHPREVMEPEVPSIWSTSLLQTLLSGPTPFSLVHLEQWKFGSRGVKPTTILTAHTDLAYWLKQYECTWLPRPQYALIGRAADGAFRTASAKEYPTQLNRVFAAAMCSRTVEVCKDTPKDTLYAAAREFESLCQQFSSDWKPDYQPI